MYNSPRDFPWGCLVRGLVTDKRRLARVVDKHQVAVEKQMLVFAHLDARIRCLGGYGTGREVHLGVHRAGWKGDLGYGLRAKGGFVYDDLLKVRVGWLRPVWLEGCHDVLGCESRCPAERKILGRVLLDAVSKTLGHGGKIRASESLDVMVQKDQVSIRC